MNALVPVNTAVAAPVEDVWRMAQAVAQSGLFGMKTPEQAMALMLVAQAEGMHPAAAARDYHVIQGRPALKADAMLARFLAAGGKVKWNAYTPERVAAVFSHPQGGEVEIEWTFAQAKAANLTGKDNWKTYPRQMLRARVISEGIRTVFPGVAVGVYTPEEVQDFEEPRRVEVRDVTPPKAQRARSEPREAPPSQKPVDRSGDTLPTPDGNDADDWTAWLRVLHRKITTAPTAEAVDAVQKAHSEGIAACAKVLDDTLTKVAGWTEARKAKLLADDFPGDRAEGVAERELEDQAA